MTIFNALTLVGGLCLFLFGMNVMGQALERRAGGKLRTLLDKMTSRVFVGFLTGLGITAILLGIAFGQSSGALSSNFAPQDRYTGSALTSDLAWLFGAGFAPMVALWLSSQFGLIAAGAYLLSGAIGTLVALWLNRELASTIG